MRHVLIIDGQVVTVEPTPAVVPDAKRDAAERSHASTADVWPLVQLFREGQFADVGQEGDYHGWSTAETAVRLIRRLDAEKPERIESELAAEIESQLAAAGIRKFPDEGSESSRDWVRAVIRDIQEHTADVIMSEAKAFADKREPINIGDFMRVYRSAVEKGAEDEPAADRVLSAIMDEFRRLRAALALAESLNNRQRLTYPDCISDCVARVRESAQKADPVHGGLERARTVSRGTV